MLDPKSKQNSKKYIRIGLELYKVTSQIRTDYSKQKQTVQQANWTWRGRTGAGRDGAGGRDKERA